MAGRVPPPFNPVLDEDGVLVPYARLFTYAEGTTTPKQTFQDSGLTTPHANPVVADDAGRFPDIWAADNSVFRLKLTKEDPQELIRDQDEVQLAGSDPDSLSRDLGANGRFRLVGSSGFPNVEFGDPVGDDTGGTGRIGGYAGTTGDTLNLDFDVLQVAGEEIAGTVVEAGSVSAATTKEIDIPAAGARFTLLISGLQLADGESLLLRAKGSTDADYRAGASDYTRLAWIDYESSGSARLAGLAASLALTGPLSNSEGKVVAAYEFGPDSARVMGSASYLGKPSAAEEALFRGGGRCVTFTGRIGSIRLLATAGAMTFRYALIARNGLPA